VAVHKAVVVAPTGFAVRTAAVHTLEEAGVDSMVFEELDLVLETWDSETLDAAIADTMETWASDQVAVVAACCIQTVLGKDMATMVLHTDWTAVGRVAVAEPTNRVARVQADFQAAADSGHMDWVVAQGTAVAQMRWHSTICWREAWCMVYGVCG
jgi:hypothetical protein